MRALMTIAAGLPDDDRDEPVAAGIDAGCPHAAAGGEAGDDQGVDAPACQRRGERGAEKGARILFGDDELVVPDVEAGGPCAQRAPCQEMPQRLRLLIEAAAVQGMLMVDDIGVDHRNPGGAGGIAHPDRGSQRVVHIGIEVADRLEIGLHEIDQDQGRTAAEAEAVFIDTLVVVGGVGAHEQIHSCIAIGQARRRSRHACLCMQSRAGRMRGHAAGNSRAARDVISGWTCWPKLSMPWTKSSKVSIKPFVPGTLAASSSSLATVA